MTQDSVVETSKLSIEAFDPYAVGGVWYTSWGYDQTNVEFFEVVRDTGKSVVLRRIKAAVQDGRLYPVPGEYRTDLHLAGNHGSETHNRDAERGYSEKMCRKQSGGYRASCKIDNTRYAWPYEGGGQYDTIAAGQMGH
jgi:hypothetical protein